MNQIPGVVLHCIRPLLAWSGATTYPTMHGLLIAVGRDNEEVALPPHVVDLSAEPNRK